MIRTLPVIGLFLLSAHTYAESLECAKLGATAAHPPLVADRVVMCMTFEPVTHQGFSEPPEIAVYAAYENTTPEKIYTLPDARTQSVIESAFTGTLAGEQIFLVLYRMSTPSTWEFTSDIYGVSAFRVVNSALAHDAALSRFFDMGGDRSASNTSFSYTYPYKTRDSINRALSTRLLRSLMANSSLSGTVITKAFLYEGGDEPDVLPLSKMYLLKGDHVTVQDATAGWCKIKYVKKADTINKWMRCSALDVS
jgi:hypothetical protein